MGESGKDTEVINTIFIMFKVLDYLNKAPFFCGFCFKHRNF